MNQVSGMNPSPSLLAAQDELGIELDETQDGDESPPIAIVVRVGADEDGGLSHGRSLDLDATPIHSSR